MSFAQVVPIPEVVALITCSDCVIVTAVTVTNRGVGEDSPQGFSTDGPEPGFIDISQRFMRKSDSAGVKSLCCTIDFLQHFFAEGMRKLQIIPSLVNEHSYGTSPVSEVNQL